MTGRGRVAVLATCAVVALITAWYAGTRSTAPDPSPAAASVRLGPDPGEPVDGYLARQAADLPPPGAAPTLALVQFTTERTGPEAVAAAEGSSLVSVVFRVPLPRVQTALRFQALDPGVAPETALDNARQRAQQAAAADAGRLTGRPGGVAVAEAAALTVPDGRDVLAVVVRADRAGLDALQDRPGVRAVQAAPEGATGRELALSPLLPEQTRNADPPPDDLSLIHI